MPRMGAIRILERAVRHGQMLYMARTGELTQLIESYDEAPPEREQIEAIARDPAALGAVLDARDALYIREVERGLVRVRCSVCKQADVELGLLFYGLALHLPPWRFFDEDRLLSVPWLAGLWPDGARPPGLMRTSRLGFVLPSVGYGQAGAHTGRLCDLPPDGPYDQEIAAFKQWEINEAHYDALMEAHPERAEEIEDELYERYHRRYNDPGFRATVRLCLALELDGIGGADPDLIESMPMADFLFLDLLYHITHHVALSAPDRALVPCLQCGARFLAVR
jgi:hypothetical protein